ncbi:50S ribosomal protein L36 [Salmonella enterica subsp. enterica]|nr:50S ribosomal protein L36 [Salmonella enterica subsp. enterica]
MQVLNSPRKCKQSASGLPDTARKGRLYVICKTNPRFCWAVQGVKRRVKKQQFESSAYRGRVRTLLPSRLRAGQRKIS